MVVVYRPRALSIWKSRRANLAALGCGSESGSRRPAGALSPRRADGGIDRAADHLPLDRTDARPGCDRRFDSLKVHECCAEKRHDELQHGLDGSLPSQSRSASSPRSATGPARISSCDTSTRHSARGGMPTSLQSSNAPRRRSRHVDRHSHRRATGRWRLAEKSRDDVGRDRWRPIALPVVGRVGAEVARFRFTSGGFVHELVADRPLRLRHRNVP